MTCSMCGPGGKNIFHSRLCPVHGNGGAGNHDSEIPDILIPTGGPNKSGVVKTGRRQIAVYHQDDWWMRFELLTFLGG